MKEKIKFFLLVNLAILPTFLLILFGGYLFFRIKYNWLYESLVKNRETLVNYTFGRIKKIDSNQTRISNLESDLEELYRDKAISSFLKSNEKEYTYPGSKNVSYTFRQTGAQRIGRTQNFKVFYEIYIEYAPDQIEDFGTAIFSLFDDDVINELSVKELDFFGKERPFLLVTVDSQNRHLETLLSPIVYYAGGELIVDYDFTFDYKSNNLNYYIKDITQEGDSLEILVERYNITDSLVDSPVYTLTLNGASYKKSGSGELYESKQ